jgi:predicted RNase H-like HicB family nuclease
MTPAYNVNIRWSQADKVFVAEAPELPGCMADGPTRREALVNIERVIREWVETAQAEGRPVPKPGIQSVRA